MSQAKSYQAPHSTLKLSNRETVAPKTVRTSDLLIPGFWREERTTQRFSDNWLVFLSRTITFISTVPRRHCRFVSHHSVEMKFGAPNTQKNMTHRPNHTFLSDWLLAALIARRVRRSFEDLAAEIFKSLKFQKFKFLDGCIFWIV